MNDQLHPENDHSRIVYIYIDNSNLFIGGQQTYATRLNHPSSNPQKPWRVDVGHLKDVIIHHSGLLPSHHSFTDRTTLYGSTPPKADSLWRAIEAKRIKVITFARSPHSNREKQVDAQIVSDAVAQAITSASRGEQCEYIIVSGDLDFMPAVRQIRECRFRIHVWSWRRGMAGEYVRLLERQPSRELVQVHCLDEYLEDISLGSGGTRDGGMDRRVGHLVSEPVSWRYPSVLPRGFVILEPGHCIDVVQAFMAELESQYLIWPHRSLWQREHSSSHDIIILFPNGAPDEGWWNNILMTAQVRLNKYRLNVVHFHHYTVAYNQWLAGSTRQTRSSHAVAEGGSDTLGRRRQTAHLRTRSRNSTTSTNNVTRAEQPCSYLSVQAGTPSDTLGHGDEGKGLSGGRRKKKGSKTKMCRHGKSCRNDGCTFLHP